MKFTLIWATKVMIILNIGLNSDILSQNQELQILSLLHQNFNSNLELSEPYYEIDSIKNYYLDYGYDNTIRQLDGCIIFFSRDTLTNKSYIGIYRNNSILWLSESISRVSLGRIVALKDINKDKKIEIVTSWNKNAWEHIWIFQWNGTSGVRINEVDGRESAIAGHMGTIILKDVDGDGTYDFIGDENYTDQEFNTVDRKMHVYTWNGVAYGNWANTPALDYQSYSMANGLDVTLNISVEELNDSLIYKYRIKNAESSSQSIKYFYLPTSIDLIDIVSSQPPGWVRKELNAAFLYFQTYFEQFEISPGASPTDFIIISNAIPALINYYIQADHIYPEINRTEESDINDIFTNSFTAYTLVPEYPDDPFKAIEFIDNVFSYLSQSLDLNWITDEQTKTKYENYFASSKDALVNGDTSSARTYLQNVLTDVDVDSSSTLTSEAYALLRYNTEYLLKQIEQ
ncbi:hypothetical protein ACFLTH_08360 [Bacteroidota bacterium]